MACTLRCRLQRRLPCTHEMHEDWQKAMALDHEVALENENAPFPFQNELGQAEVVCERKRKADCFLCVTFLDSLARSRK